MARWQPDARSRLEASAMALYLERGFDETTVADIAAHAGLTERTFFRYFTDKREVLFGGASRLEALIVDAVAAMPPDTRPLDAVAAGLEATSPLFAERRPFARKRQGLIAGHAELRERELIKLATLGSAIAAALTRRGVSDQAASLAADAGIAVFKLAFERWVEDAKNRDLAHHLRESFSALRAVATEPAERRASPGSPRRRTGSAPGRRPRAR